MTQEQGKRLAEEMKAVFIETSAKENQVCTRFLEKQLMALLEQVSISDTFL